MMLKWFFDYLYWFQIFKDQCLSVPCIPVACPWIMPLCNMMFCCIFEWFLWAQLLVRGLLWFGSTSNLDHLLVQARSGPKRKVGPKKAGQKSGPKNSGPQRKWPKKSGPKKSGSKKVGPKKWAQTGRWT